MSSGFFMPRVDSHLAEMHSYFHMNQPFQFSKIATWRQVLAAWTAPRGLTYLSGVRYWQERILRILLMVSVVFGFIVWIASVALSIKEDLWFVAVADTLIYGYICFLMINRRLSYQHQAVSFICISYCLGLILICVLGPHGAGPVWLFAFPLIAGILMGFRASLLALAVNALTLVVIGLILYHTDTLPWHYPGLVNPIEKWVVTSLNFMLLNTIVALSVTTILQGLQSSVAALKVSNDKFQRIYDNILDVYFETTLDGIITQISPSIRSISRYSPQDLIDTSVTGLYRDITQREYLLAELLEKGNVQGFEIDLTDQDGSVRSCSVNARLMVDAQGAPLGIVGSCRDISQDKAIRKEKKNLEQRLHRSSKMEALGILAGGVAHDLNNILSGIVGYPELMIMELPDDSPFIEPLTAILETGEKASEIVQDLLTLSRRGVMTREVVNLNDIVTGFLKSPEFLKIRSFHPLTDFRKELTSSQPFISGSLVHLAKTVMNLVANSAEAQPYGGTVTITTRDIHLAQPLKAYVQINPGTYVMLRVEDDGTGIAPQDIDRIFEPFFTKKIMGRSGTGLGMAVVWGTVQDHDGYIDVQSQEGKGTVFSLYFPMAESNVLPPPIPAALEDISGNNETILVVDDLKLQRDVNISILKKLNYRVSAVSSGEAAVEHLKSFPADLILLDMIMEPGIGGLETYRRVLEINPVQKAIIISGFSETESVRQVKEMGAAGYVKKPFSVETIGRAVKRALSGS